MRNLRVNIPSREYNIYIENGLLNRCGELISEVFGGEKIAVVTDSNVFPLYAKTVEESLKNSGFKATVITVPAGEKSKSHKYLGFLYDELLKFGITRTDLIVALGGGVVGDLTGYAAASLLRGIPFVQIPTTLLAQVDSSVGGKVAVNLPQGKNLVGAFYQPKLVIIDPLCLKTLSPRVLSDGMAEVIKHGAIADEKLFETLENVKDNDDLFKKLGDIIYECCDIKRRVVEEDEHDTGGRMVLNFGHTFGHAIEKKYNYETYTHGEAVGAGMIMACEFGEKIGLTPQGTALRMTDILKKYDLPTEIEIGKDELTQAMAVDKKGDGSMISLILLGKIGRAVIKKFAKDEVRGI